MNGEERPLKFEGCEDCIFRKIKKVCRECDAGELFEEKIIAVDEFFNDNRY